MSLLRVGTGGWDFFQVPHEGSLSAYSRGFDFVEVNNTYYVFQNLRALLSWRKAVPAGFEFSVRCNQRLVRDYCSGKKPVNLERRDLDLASVVQTCKLLKANVLTILLSDSNQASVSGLESFFSDFHSGGTRVAVEVRGASPSQELIQLLERNDGIHCVDISRGEEPLVESGVLYSRLFGRGQENIYEFDDGELREIASKASSPRFEKSILAFHGVRMYRDAARLKSFLSTGKFPSLTSNTGLDALEKVLEEDARFPLTRDELVQSQGWKLFDLTTERRVRAEAFLCKLPDTTFLTAKMVRNRLESFIPQATGTTSSSASRNS